MDVNQINAYLDRAREIMRDRSSHEIEYEDAVVAHLSAGKDIRRAIRAANEEYPDEALEPHPDQRADVLARYRYLMEHKAILKKLGMRE